MASEHMHVFNTDSICAVGDCQWFASDEIEELCEENERLSAQVTELQEANTREVLRRREAEAEIACRSVKCVCLCDPCMECENYDDEMNAEHGNKEPTDE